MTQTMNRWSPQLAGMLVIVVAVTAGFWIAEGPAAAAVLLAFVALCTADADGRRRSCARWPSPARC